MDELLATLIVAAFFVMRLGIPLLFVLMVGYFMSRLDAYWQAHP